MTREEVLKEATECMNTVQQMGDCWVHEINYDLDVIRITVSGDDLASEISIDEFVGYYKADED